MSKNVCFATAVTEWALFYSDLKKNTPLTEIMTWKPLNWHTWQTQMKKVQSEPTHNEKNALRSICIIVLEKLTHFRVNFSTQ